MKEKPKSVFTVVVADVVFLIKYFDNYELHQLSDKSYPENNFLEKIDYK